MAADTRSRHQFVVSNDAGVVIRCCIHCGLSHLMDTYQDQQTNIPGRVWNLIYEERENEAFAEPCPGESGSNHHRQIGDAVVIRFCARCGLSHHLVWALLRTPGIEVPYPWWYRDRRVPYWRYIKENEQDITVSDLCPVEQGSDALKQR